MDLSALDTPYLSPTLPETLPANPLDWAAAWLDEARRQAIQPNANSMSLATVDRNGRPSSRIVLCKQLVADPGYVVFYTNYESRKCRELFDNPEVALLFHWDRLGRQVRIEGPAMRSPEAESDAYFSSRHRGSQLGAWGSDQSQPIASRQELLTQVAARSERFEDHAVTRPPHWGGVRVWARQVELWLDGRDRVHDRGSFGRTLDIQTSGHVTVGPWTSTRLQP